MDAKVKDSELVKERNPQVSSTTFTEAPVNASGHHQELDRNFNLLSICALAITSGNTWVALGGSVTVAIYDGGPPGVLYEFIAVSLFYWLIAASIAELASAMPSAGGVYHWASITAGRHGRITGFFAGYLNFLAWIFGLAATAQIAAAQVVSMYAAFHPAFVTQRWHVFVAYLIFTWISCFLVLFANKLLPVLESIGGFLIISGVFITIVVCASMPDVHATNDFVWRDWQNSTGYTSNGFVFLLGMLNGAFAVGTPDVVSHLAEEIPRPTKNIPKAILAQFVVGFISSFAYLISLFYSISDLNSVLDSRYLFPLATIYDQATNSASGTVGLLVLAFLPNFIALIGVFITSSRMFWTLARDNATPFASTFAKVSTTYKNPFNSVLFCAVISTILGCIYLGSSTAFNAFVGSFVVLSSLSYLAAILPHLLNRRSGIKPGWFWMPGAIGFVVNTVACLYIITFIVIFCFPFSLPVSASTMNYASLMIGGLSLFVVGFWFMRKGAYEGPKYVPLDAEILAADAI